MDSRENVDCHAVQAPLAMTEKNAASKKVDSRNNTKKYNHTAGGRIFDEKVGLCSLLCGDKPSGLSHKQKANSPLFRKKPTPKPKKEKQ